MVAPAVAACGGDEAAPVTTAATTTTIGELPPPDPADHTGAARVVNLYLDAGGNTPTVDVWGRRAFTSGPILPAEGIGFGEVSG